MRSRWLHALSALCSVCLGVACAGEAPLAPDAAARRDLAFADTLERDAAGADLGAPADLGADAAAALPALGRLTMFINLGDSIAAGQGVARPYAELLLHNDDGAYPAYAGRDLATRYPTLKLADHSRGGATSAGVIEQAKLAPANPAGNTLVALSIGGNDLINNATALMSADQTRQIAQTVSANVTQALRVFADKARYPGEVFIVALNVYEMTDGQGTIPEGEPVVTLCAQLQALGPVFGTTMVQNFDVFNTTLEAAFAQQGLLLIDVHEAFLGHAFHYKDTSHPHYHADDPTLWLQYDCIHPNQAGHDAIRRLIWRRLFGE